MSPPFAFFLVRHKARLGATRLGSVRLTQRHKPSLQSGCIHGMIISTASALSFFLLLSPSLSLSPWFYFFSDLLLHDSVVVMLLLLDSLRVRSMVHTHTDDSFGDGWRIPALKLAHRTRRTRRTLMPKSMAQGCVYIV